MPSGIDAALGALKMANIPEPNRISFNGFEGMQKKKPTVSETTIDPEEMGLEPCRKLISEHEAKMKQTQDKIAALPPSKKNKPEIATLKEKAEKLQYDGNYRAALSFVRQSEEEERARIRDEREKQDEEALAAGDLKVTKRGTASSVPSGSQAQKKKEAAPRIVVEETAFVMDEEVAGVVQSAVEGSEDAQKQLGAGSGAIKYKSDVCNEIASMASSAAERVPPKLKRAATRDGALRTVRALLWNPPAVLPSYPAILMMLEETKLKSEPNGKATDLCLQIARGGFGGKAIPALILPVLLAHTGAAASGKWQVKVAVMGILKNVLHHMNEPGMCPKQLGMAMPKVMAALRDAVGDARKEVKREAEALLRHMGKELAQNPEIAAMADDIIGSIVDSANMEKAADTLTKLANTTFLNSVDSCSFGLLFPVVTRAMRERSHDAKTRGVQIMGASVNLIVDPEFLQPYVSELLPLLKECLMHPTHGIQREASKSFGALASGLPALCDEEIYPFLLDKLESQDINADVSEVDRRGAAHGLAEVLLARKDLLPACLYKIVLPRITSGKTLEAKAGGLALFQFIAHLGSQAFLTHLPRCLPAILGALTEESEVVTKQAVAAVKVLIDEYGSTYPKLLLPRMQECLFFEQADARDLAMQLFFALCEKVAEAVKFGQDLLSFEALPTWYRHSLLCSIYIARTDSNPSVRRMATLLWKEKIQSGQKAKSEILPLLLRIAQGLKDSGKGAQVSAADNCVAELVSGGDTSHEAFGQVEAWPRVGGILFAEGPQAVLGLNADGTLGGMPESKESSSKPRILRGQLLQERVPEQLAAIKLVNPLRTYIEAVVTSCCIETRTRVDAEAAAEVELSPITDKKTREKAGSALAALGLSPAFDKIFDGIPDQEDEGTTAEDDPDCLVMAKNLMMMYGGGNLLLKNTTLEMRRGRRYGVVGRNGAGKTTLMSTIAAGGVKQIPSSVKILHVRPEVLVEASDLTAVQFCKRDNPKDISEDSLQAALQEVGFPSNMQAKSVNELSGGWRMKLLLASAMMRECDLLLLDEPTNHLDNESVEWLSTYLKSLSNTSLMVISHDPHFLNEVCTDIIQYSAQKTLDYYEGNFADFRKQRHISSDEEAEALLLGRDYDEGKEPEPSASVEAGEGEEVTGMTAGLLDKQSKISFPVPGKLVGHSSVKPVMELKNVFFAYNEQEGPLILKDVTCKLSLTSRVGIVGANGAGKSTLLNLLCGELVPCQISGSATGIGEVTRNRNLRLAYIAQQHMFHLQEYLNCSPYVYIQKRFKNGWDEALQTRLIEPATEEEAKMRLELAKRYGKYGNEVGEILGRVVRGNEMFYEVQWKNLEDPKQNTYEPFSKLKTMGVASLAKAYDERLASQSAGIDQRPLSQREIVKHLEQFGLDEEIILNREIGGFSAGQKSKLTLGAAFWTKPHMVALDEPTNYIDMETLDALAKGLARFKGGVVVISHSSDFVERICDETWLVEGGTITKTTKKGKK